jgi:4-hydroxy-2-oxoheptanedioate aldolase
MRANRLRASLKSGQPAVGGWCVIPNSLSAEIVASLGFPYVCIDMQHGLMDFGTTVSMLQAMAAHGPTPIVRVPIGDYALAQRLLDAGAEGVIFPMINTAAEARDAVATCRYGPAGRRSIGPTRSQMHLGGDTHNADAEVLCLVMIETVEAVENIDEILAVPGLDGVYVGPADLGLSLGLELGQDHPRRDEAIDRVLAACRRHGAIAAIHTPSGAGARSAIERGFVMASISSEAAILTEAYRTELAIATGRTPADAVAEAV